MLSAEFKIDESTLGKKEEEICRSVHEATVITATMTRVVRDGHVEEMEKWLNLWPDGMMTNGKKKKRRSGQRRRCGEPEAEEIQHHVTRRRRLSNRSQPVVRVLFKEILLSYNN